MTERADGPSTSAIVTARWTMYFDLEASQSIETIITELSEDPTCVFWG